MSWSLEGKHFRRFLVSKWPPLQRPRIAPAWGAAQQTKRLPVVKKDGRTLVCPPASGLLCCRVDATPFSTQLAANLSFHMRRQGDGSGLRPVRRIRRLPGRLRFGRFRRLAAKCHRSQKRTRVEARRGKGRERLQELKVVHAGFLVPPSGLDPLQLSSGKLVGLVGAILDCAAPCCGSGGHPQWPAVGAASAVLTDQITRTKRRVFTLWLCCVT